MGPSKNQNLSAKDVMNSIAKEHVRWLDLQFVDLLGALQHISVPTKSVDEGSFKGGIGKLDGSSIKGFKEIHESDMVLSPDPATSRSSPGAADSTARTSRTGKATETATRRARSPASS